jgi:antitoxin component YwqK of YwqJK toxin-antitoxin module
VRGLLFGFTATLLVLYAGGLGAQSDGDDAAQARYFASNAAGERLEQIPERAFGRHRYVLLVEDGEDGRREILYRGSVPVRRKQYGPEGELRYTDTHQYYADNKLQHTRREYADGRVVESRYEFVDDRLYAEWHETGAETELFRYDASGRIVRVKRWVEETLVRDKRYSYEDEDREPERIVIEEPQEERRELRELDEQGRVLRTQVTKDGREVSTTAYEYGEHGVLAERTTTPEGTQRTRFRYDDEGNLQSETQFTDDRMAKQIEYAEGQRRIETLYRQGEAVLRVHYRGETRVKEEVMRDGEVTEVRELAEEGEADREKADREEADAGDGNPDGDGSSARGSGAAGASGE